MVRRKAKKAKRGTKAKAGPPASTAVARRPDVASELGAELIERLKRSFGAEKWGQLMASLREPPLVVFMGTTGVGKSTTCNAIFGRKLFPTDAVDPCTRGRQQQTLRLEQGAITFVDLPGIGEDVAKGREYEEGYVELLTRGFRTDGGLRTPAAVVWVLKADQRVHEADERLWKAIPQACRDRFLFAVNQARKIDPIDDWDRAASAPGPEQSKNLARKRTSVAKLFGVPESRVVVYSALEGFNLVEFLDGLVACLPRRNVPIVVGRAEDADEQKSPRDRSVSDPVREKAATAWWDEIVAAAKEVLPAVAVAAVKQAWRVAKRELPSLWKVIRTWFR